MSAPRRWSLITGEQLAAHVDEASKVIRAAGDLRIHPFAGGVAGVALIRNAIETMGGDVAWWIDFLRTGQLPGGPSAAEEPRQ